MYSRDLLNVLEIVTEMVNELNVILLCFVQIYGSEDIEKKRESCWSVEANKIALDVAHVTLCTDFCAKFFIKIKLINSFGELDPKSI